MMKMLRLLGFFVTEPLSKIFQQFLKIVLTLLFNIKKYVDMLEDLNCSAISWPEQVIFKWDDDEIRFLLDQQLQHT